MDGDPYLSIIPLWNLRQSNNSVNLLKFKSQRSILCTVWKLDLLRKSTRKCSGLGKASSLLLKDEQRVNLKKIREYRTKILEDKVDRIELGSLKLLKEGCKRVSFLAITLPER